MSRVIFASHGGLSKGMKDSVSMIVGDLAKNVETYSLLPGQNPEDYYNSLRKEIEAKNEQTIILCDIKGGSVHTALSKLAILNNVFVFSGMNMGLALDIVLRSSQTLDEELLSHLLDDAKKGLTLMNGISNDTDDEEF